MNVRSCIASTHWKTFSFHPAARNVGQTDPLASRGRTHGRTMALRLVAAAACLTLLLAGCSQSKDSDGEGDGPPAADAASYTIMLSEFPVAPLEGGQEFPFNSTISGGIERASDHIGAHFGPNSTTAPSTTAYPSVCPHSIGQLPGTFQVTCAAPLNPGVYYLRGHARITYGNESVNWWSAETTFTVAPLQN